MITLSVHYADDPKLLALARWPESAGSARDLYLQMVCYCKINMTDGLVPREALGKIAFPAPLDLAAKWAEMLVSTGVVTESREGWYVPAFLKRNKSREEITGETETASQAGSRGNHVRWHVGKGKVDPTCTYCWGLDGTDNAVPTLSTPPTEPENQQSTDHRVPDQNPIPDPIDSGETQELSDSPWFIGSASGTRVGSYRGANRDKDVDVDKDSGPDRPDRAPKPRGRDALWDSVVAACGIEQTEITKSMRGSINAALRDLREVGATAPEVGVRARRYRRRWPNVSLTPTALAKQWASLTVDSEPTAPARDPRDEARIKARRGNSLAAAL